MTVRLGNKGRRDHLNSGQNRFQDKDYDQKLNRPVKRLNHQEDAVYVTKMCSN